MTLIKKDIWNQIKTILESKLPKGEFRTWFSQATLKKLEPNIAIIGVPNKFVANWLHDRYLIEIRKCFKAALKESPQIHFVYDHPSTTKKVMRPDAPRNTEPYQGHSLNPLMTFDRLFVTDSNRFACSSALEVANRPAAQYNPLYIFCERSLGKTHLLNAIGNHALKKNPFIRVRYLSSDTFTSDFAYSINHNKLQQFRERYCGLDFLLFDDIHLLADRIKTQDEFLFIFNALYGAKKQIVVTGNGPPNRLGRIDSSVRSRLEWGLLTEVQILDQNAKIEIIKRKAKEDGIDIPGDVISFLAKSNRDLKSLVKSIVRLETYTSLNKGDINISLAKSLIKNKNRTEIGIDDIKSVTAGYFNILPSELTSNKKQRRYSYPRQLAMYLARKYTDLSLKEIGNSFGKKDHSTVIYAIRRIEKDKDQKKEIRDDVNIIESLLS